jgi:hypothetical protein
MYVHNFRISGARYLSGILLVVLQITARHLSVQLLLHHVIPGAFEMTSLQDEMTGVSLAGTQLRVNMYTTQDVQWNEVKVRPFTHFNRITCVVVEALCYKPEGRGFETR